MVAQPNGQALLQGLCGSVDFSMFFGPGTEQWYVLRQNSIFEFPHGSSGCTSKEDEKEGKSSAGDHGESVEMSISEEAKQANNLCKLDVLGRLRHRNWHASKA
jgi:hypothetical protein